MRGTADLNQILVFVRVVRAGSFSEAARQLGVPKATVSRKVSELEGRLGARLLQRTTRKLSLTEAGRVYFDRTAPSITEIEEAEHSVRQLQAVPRGTLRVSIPLMFGMLGPIVAEYLELYPEVQVEIVCTDRKVDLVDERFDAAIRTGALADSTLVARKLGTSRAALVAAPSYCKRRGEPRTPAEVTTHECIVFGAGTSPALWILEAGTKRSEVRVTPRLAVNDMEIMRSVALAGAGITWLPELFCGADIRKGRLRQLLPDWCMAPVPVHAVYPTARQVSPKVVTFVDLVAKRLRFDGEE